MLPLPLPLLPVDGMEDTTVMRERRTAEAVWCLSMPKEEKGGKRKVTKWGRRRFCTNRRPQRTLTTRGIRA